MKVVKIANVKKHCRCGSWLNHWYNYTTTSTTVQCGNLECYGDAEMGVIVKKCIDFEDCHYVVPLCYTCSQLDVGIDKGMIIWDGVPLVQLSLCDDVFSI